MSIKFILQFLLFAVVMSLLLASPSYMRQSSDRELRPTEFLTVKKLFIEAGLSQDDLKEGVYFYTLTSDVSHEGYERVVTIKYRTYWRKKTKR